MAQENVPVKSKLFTLPFETIKNYKRISPIGVEGQAHLTDIWTPKPMVLKPNANAKKDKSPDDVTDFPEHPITNMMECIPYPEGSYRPPSMPVMAAYPINMYLEKGKVYFWCACGTTQENPWCNGQCKWVVTRLRPIYFNVDKAGYYKLCNCKMSANAPFCNGTHQLLFRYWHRTHRGFYTMWGAISTWVMITYFYWNYYT